jgi:type VI secretion system secreted protein Hcp
MQIYLHIPNVTGDSTAAGFEGQFEAESFIWGGGSIVNAGTTRSFTTSSTAVSVSKLGEMNSPTLMLFMVTKSTLNSVVITMTKVVNSKNLPAQVYTLSNALISSFSQSAGRNSVPDENMTFTFSRITYQQLYYDSAGIKTGDETHYWDVAGKVAG